MTQDESREPHCLKDPPNKISIVVPCYNEEGNIEPLFEAISRNTEGFNWELILVDDGSSDGTFRMIRALVAKTPRVRGIRFSRNFGHQYALLAGLSGSSGDVIVTIDADLQHPPELIKELVRAWREGFNMVHTRRISEGQLTWFKRKTSDVYYSILTWLSDIKVEEGASDFRLMDRRVVDTVLSMQEADLFLRGLVTWMGFRQKTLEYKVRPRYSGTSKYTLSKMLRFAMTGITSFSTVPLRMGILIGFVTSGLAFVELIYVVYSKFQGKVVPGWTSMTALLSFLFGVSFILLGMMGIYIGHIFRRVQNRSLYIIEEDTGTLSSPKVKSSVHNTL